MNTTSAHPDRLDQFVARTSALHGDVAEVRRSLSPFAAAVRSNCIDFGIDTPSLDASAVLFEAMGDNDRFVTTIRDELMRADGRPADGMVTVDDVVVRAALERAGVGAAPAQVEFDPATMYGLPLTSGFVDDPICAANGNMIHQDLDLQFPSLAAALDVRRTYNSLLTRRAGAFGCGFSSVYDVRLGIGSGRVDVQLPDGATGAFVRTDDGWESAGRRLTDFHEHDDGWTVHTDAGCAFHFTPRGSLTGWTSGVAHVDATRDSSGRIVTLRERSSGRRVHVDWVDDRIAQVATGDGRTVSYTYAGAGPATRLVRVTSASGALGYEWEDGFLVAVVDSDGVRPFRNTYDDDGRVVRQHSPFGRVTSYRYEASGLTVVTDDAGTRQAMVHDPRGNLTAIIDVDGSAMRFAYDHADRPIRVVERDGATWEYRYDVDTGDLVERLDPDGRTVAWSWDAEGRVIARTDRAGGTTMFEYLPRLRTPVRIVDPAAGATSIDVDPELDRPVCVVDSDGVATRYEYDADGQVVATVDAHGNRTEFGYDAAGRLTRLVDPTGAVIALAYDAAGRVSSYDHAGRRGTFEYSPAGRATGGSEPGCADRRAWSAQFGEHGAPVAVTDSAGHTIHVDYDLMGNVVAIITADGATYHRFHDQLGRPVGDADPSGATTHLRYDEAGRLVEATDAAGRTYRREVDVLGRTTRSVGPDGAVTTWAYHPGGQIAEITMADGRTWSTEVDELGRVVGVTDPAGATAQSSYTPGGRLLERRSPAGRVERFEYDAAGLLVAVTGVDGRRHEFERDASGRMTAAVSDGARNEFARDGAGRVVGHRVVDRVGAELRHDRFGYDAAGRLTSRSDATGARIEYEWDSRGLLRAATDPSGGTLEYSYDSRGRLISQTAPGDRVTSFGYDLAGRLDRLTDPAGVHSRFDYDPSGVVVGQFTGQHGTRATLDAAGRVAGRADLDGRLLAEFGYDATGRLIEARRGVHAERFLWDDNDRLAGTVTAAGSSFIERDPAGWASGLVRADGTRLMIERARSGHVVAVGGIARPDGQGGARIERDLAGRLLLGRDGRAYHYDGAGRLARIEAPDGSDTTLTYGDDGLLVTERSAAGVRRFAYDDAGRVTSIDAEGRGSTTYCYDDVGRRVAELRPDGTSIEFEWEGLDVLTAITRVDADRATRVAIECDAFGRPVRVGETVIAYDPISGLPARLGDVEVINLPDGSWRSDTGQIHAIGPGPTGLRVGALTFLGARVHDAVTNQFLSPDPLLPRPGTPGAASAYTYAWHDPVNHVDPSGCRPISLDDWSAMREREERGRVGDVVSALGDDPWGTALMVGVAAAGGVLVATGVGTIGVPILIGMATTATVGVATGDFDPVDVALGGAFGAVGGGIAHGARLGLISTRAAIAASGSLGTAEEMLGQARAGEGFDLRSGLAAGIVSGATFGAGEYIDPRTITAGAATGAVTQGAGSIGERVLAGQPLSATSVMIDTASGGVAGGFGVHFDHVHRRHQIERAHELALPDLRAIGPAGGVLESTTVDRVVTSVAEEIIFDETGLVVGDALAEGVDGINDLVPQTASSVGLDEPAVARSSGDRVGHAVAEADFDTGIETVSGARSRIESTDGESAARVAGPGATVLTAELAPDRSAVPVGGPGATVLTAELAPDRYQGGSIASPYALATEPLPSEG